MSDAPSYRIETLSDFVKIPSDRLGMCFRDLQYAVELHHFVYGAVAESVPFGPGTWTDDSDHSVAINGADGKPMLVLEVRDNREAAES